MKGEKRKAKSGRERGGWGAAQGGKATGFLKGSGLKLEWVAGLWKDWAEGRT